MEYSALETPSTSLTELETSTETSESEETSSFEQSASNPMVNIHHMMQSELEKVIMRRLSGDIGAGIASTEMDMIPDGGFYDASVGYGRMPADEKSADGQHLIAPRKPPHPNKEKPELRELQRELAFNNKMGINVLGQKSELQKAMEKMRGQVFKKQLDEEKRNNRSDLERQLEKRALRLQQLENVMAEQPVDNPNFQNSGNEFHRMHAKVNGRFASATS